jgi:hypothetical protein
VIVEPIDGAAAGLCVVAFKDGVAAGANHARTWTEALEHELGRPRSNLN